MDSGCFTALATPFQGDAIDFQALDRLVDFQLANHISGILAVGTTGESPAFDWQEHNQIVEKVVSRTKGKCISIAGAGSNNTREALSATGHAVAKGVDAVLLVDPYYNGPSSLEIRREYYTPVAKAHPATRIIPYIIPGRTGAQLLPEDLALLAAECPNVDTVKEATGNLENMRRTRACCGARFNIFSGDDGLTLDMMTDPDIEAAGVISVASNVVPGPMTKMVNLLANGRIDEGRVLAEALTPLFGLVTVKTTEKTRFGEVVCRARNPLAIKTFMAILGMIRPGCRRPLGKMSAAGLQKVLEIGRKVQSANPELLQPVAEFFKVDIEERLNTPAFWEGLAYDEY